jgi:hypothetical protein
MTILLMDLEGSRLVKDSISKNTFYLHPQNIHCMYNMCKEPGQSTRLSEHLVKASQQCNKVAGTWAATNSDFERRGDSKVWNELYLEVEVKTIEMKRHLFPDKNAWHILVK